MDSFDDSVFGFCLSVPDQSEDKDQTKLVVGVVVGLLVAILVVALVYWVYMRKSKYVNLNFRQS